jgi:membrane associated rhomboid family serine protease
MYQQYRPLGTSGIPLVVKNLMIINGLAFLGSLLFMSRGWGDLSDKLGLYFPSSDYFRPFQIVTHIFMHSSFSHLGYNMFALWMFGSFLENFWGPKRFLIFYIITGFGAAALYLGVNYFEISQIKAAIAEYMANQGYEQMNILLRKDPLLMNKEAISEILYAWSADPTNPKYFAAGQEIANAILLRKINTPMVGASGAVFGVLLGNGVLFPNREIHLFFFPFPIKVKYIVLVLGGMELMDGLGNNPMDNVAHFAHLGGMLFGFILIKYWNKTDRSSFY